MIPAIREERQKRGKSDEGQAWFEQKVFWPINYGLATLNLFIPGIGAVVANLVTWGIIFFGLHFIGDQRIRPPTGRIVLVAAVNMLLFGILQYFGLDIANFIYTSDFTLPQIISAFFANALVFSASTLFHHKLNMRYLEKSLGLCVTGDTLLPILGKIPNPNNCHCERTKRAKQSRRRLLAKQHCIVLRQSSRFHRDYLLAMTNSQENVKVRNVYISDVKPGDYVLSLNEKTQQIEPHRINALLDMGVKPVYKLTTASGRTIKTTANHPYLTKNGWVKVGGLKIGDFIGVPNRGLPSSIGICSGIKTINDNSISFNIKTNSIFSNSESVSRRGEINQWFSEKKRCSRNEEEFKFSINSFLDLMREFIKFTFSMMSKINYICHLLNHFNPSSRFIFSKGTNPNLLASSIPFLSLATNFGFIGRRSSIASMSQPTGLWYTYSLSGACSSNFSSNEHNKSHNEYVSNRKYLGTPPLSKTTAALNFLGKASPFFFNSSGISTNFGNNSNLTGIFGDSFDNEACFISQPPYVNKANIFLKKLSSLFCVSELEASELTAGDILWDKIVSIEYIGREHVYDIEVEGTHNFIGNGIFAHNTYVQKSELEGWKKASLSKEANPDAGMIPEDDSLGEGLHIYTQNAKKTAWISLGAWMMTLIPLYFALFNLLKKMQRQFVRFAFIFLLTFNLFIGCSRMNGLTPPGYLQYPQSQNTINVLPPHFSLDPLGEELFLRLNYILSMSRYSNPADRSYSYYEEYLQHHSETLEMQVRILNTAYYFFKENPEIGNYLSFETLSEKLRYLVITDLLPIPIETTSLDIPIGEGVVGGLAVNELGIIVLNKCLIEVMKKDGQVSPDWQLNRVVIHELLHLTYPDKTEMEIWDKTLQILKPFIPPGEQFHFNTARFLTDIMMEALGKWGYVEYYKRPLFLEKQVHQPIRILGEIFKTGDDDILYLGYKGNVLFFEVKNKKYSINPDLNFQIIEFEPSHFEINNVKELFISSIIDRWIRKNLSLAKRLWPKINQENLTPERLSDFAKQYPSLDSLSEALRSCLFNPFGQVYFYVEEYEYYRRIDKFILSFLPEDQKSPFQDVNPRLVTNEKDDEKGGGSISPSVKGKTGDGGETVNFLGVGTVGKTFKGMLKDYGAKNMLASSVITGAISWIFFSNPILAIVAFACLQVSLINLFRYLYDVGAEEDAMRIWFFLEVILKEFIKSLLTIRFNFASGWAILMAFFLFLTPVIAAAQPLMPTISARVKSKQQVKVDIEEDLNRLLTDPSYRKDILNGFDINTESLNTAIKSKSSIARFALTTEMDIQRGVSYYMVVHFLRSPMGVIADISYSLEKREISSKKEMVWSSNSGSWAEKYSVNNEEEIRLPTLDKLQEAIEESIKDTPKKREVSSSEKLNAVEDLLNVQKFSELFPSFFISEKTIAVFIENIKKSAENGAVLLPLSFGENQPIVGSLVVYFFIEPSSGKIKVSYKLRLLKQGQFYCWRIQNGKVGWYSEEGDSAGNLSNLDEVKKAVKMAFNVYKQEGNFTKISLPATQEEKEVNEELCAVAKKELQQRMETKKKQLLAKPQITVTSQGEVTVYIPANALPGEVPDHLLVRQGAESYIRDINTVRETDIKKVYILFDHSGSISAQEAVLLYQAVQRLTEGFPEQMSYGLVFVSDELPSSDGVEVDLKAQDLLTKLPKNNGQGATWLYTNLLNIVRYAQEKSAVIIPTDGVSDTDPSGKGAPEGNMGQLWQDILKQARDKDIQLIFVGIDEPPESTLNKFVQQANEQGVRVAHDAVENLEDLAGKLQEVARRITRIRIGFSEEQVEVFVRNARDEAIFPREGDLAEPQPPFQDVPVIKESVPPMAFDPSTGTFGPLKIPEGYTLVGTRLNIEEMTFPLKEVETKRKSESIFLALDLSGSMAGKPLETLKQAMQKILQNPTLDIQGIVTFRGNPMEEKPVCFYQTKTDFESMINSLSASGTTPGWQALEQSIDVLLEMKIPVEKFIILTDGLWDRLAIGTSGEINMPAIREKLLRLIKEKGAKIFIFASSKEYNQAFKETQTVLRENILNSPEDPQGVLELALLTGGEVVVGDEEIIRSFQEFVETSFSTTARLPSLEELVSSIDVILRGPQGELVRLRVPIESIEGSVPEGSVPQQLTNWQTRFQDALQSGDLKTAEIILKEVGSYVDGFSLEKQKVYREYQQQLEIAELVEALNEALKQEDEPRVQELLNSVKPYFDQKKLTFDQEKVFRGAQDWLSHLSEQRSYKEKFEEIAERIREAIKENNIFDIDEAVISEHFGQLDTIIQKMEEGFFNNTLIEKMKQERDALKREIEKLKKDMKQGSEGLGKRSYIQPASEKGAVLFNLVSIIMCLGFITIACIIWSGVLKILLQVAEFLGGNITTLGIAATFISFLGIWSFLSSLIYVWCVYAESDSPPGLGIPLMKVSIVEFIEMFFLAFGKIRLHGIIGRREFNIFMNALEERSRLGIPLGIREEILLYRKCFEAILKTNPDLRVDWGNWLIKEVKDPAVLKVLIKVTRSFYHDSRVFEERWILDLLQVAHHLEDHELRWEIFGTLGLTLSHQPWLVLELCYLKYQREMRYLEKEIENAFCSYVRDSGYSLGVHQQLSHLIQCLFNGMLVPSADDIDTIINYMLEYRIPKKSSLQRILPLILALLIRMNPSLRVYVEERKKTLKKSRVKEIIEEALKISKKNERQAGLVGDFTHPVIRQLEDCGDGNVTCGTVCQAGHEGSHHALDEQLKRQFEELSKILQKDVIASGSETISDSEVALLPVAPRNDELTEEEADRALVEYAKKFGIEVTFGQLQEYRRQIREAEKGSWD